MCALGGLLYPPALNQPPGGCGLGMRLPSLSKCTTPPVVAFGCGLCLLWRVRIAGRKKSTDGLWQAMELLLCRLTFLPDKC